MWKETVVIVCFSSVGCKLEAFMEAFDSQGCLYEKKREIEKPRVAKVILQNSAPKKRCIGVLFPFLSIFFCGSFVSGLHQVAFRGYSWQCLVNRMGC